MSARAALPARTSPAGHAPSRGSVYARPIKSARLQLAARKPLDPNDTEIYALISNARDALDELASKLEERGA